MVVASTIIVEDKEESDPKERHERRSRSNRWSDVCRVVPTAYYFTSLNGRIEFYVLLYCFATLLHFLPVCRGQCNKVVVPINFIIGVDDLHSVPDG